MTVVVIWVLLQLNAPAWCYILVLGMFLLKCLYMIGREKE